MEFNSQAACSTKSVADDSPPAHWPPRPQRTLAPVRNTEGRPPGLGRRSGFETPIEYVAVLGDK